MLSVQDPEILSLVPDYRINLFSPAEIKDEELNKLQSNLREVMLFIKYAKDKRKLKELTSENSSFQSLELKAARVIDSITGINLRFTETERSVNMCQAVQEMCDDARAEGHASGLSEGHAQGLRTRLYSLRNACCRIPGSRRRISADSQDFHLRMF